MSWKLDATMKLQDERLFGDRLVRCFAERPRSVDALLRNAVARSPSGEAVFDGGDRVTYRALDQIVDRIALLLRNSAAFIELVLASTRIGAITVPINVAEQTPELATYSITPPRRFWSTSMN